MLHVFLLETDTCVADVEVVHVLTKSSLKGGEGLILFFARAVLIKN